MVTAKLALMSAEEIAWLITQHTTISCGNVKINQGQLAVSLTEALVNEVRPKSPQVIKGIKIIDVTDEY